MTIQLILGGAALVGITSAGFLLLVIAGIRRSERGKRLTRRPASQVEAFTQRLLTGSRGCGLSDQGERR